MGKVWITLCMLTVTSSMALEKKPDSAPVVSTVPAKAGVNQITEPKIEVEKVAGTGGVREGAHLKFIGRNGQIAREMSLSSEKRRSRLKERRTGRLVESELT